MKVVKLLHNPGAGDEEHSKEKLTSTLETNGFECRYSSTKKKISKSIEPDVDLLVVAGGDGTVRNVVEDLLDRNMLEKNWPIGLLPLGTANNIAKTLDIHGEPEDIIPLWQNSKLKKYDVGRLYEVPESKFFLESFGYGLFPYLIQEMKKSGKEKSAETPEEKILRALQLLHDITLSYEAKECKLIVDGVDHSGRFLLAEIMNTRSIGPNLFLAPHADPGDGVLEVVIVPEDEREKFADYVQHKINGREENYSFQHITGKNIRISWDGNHVHVDDSVVKLKKSAEIRIELKEGLLEFLVP